ncbi:MAG: lipopolysaccharide ABC transporter ATP-binding protein, partial [Acidobacteria bacterium]|nr:lipopolysaccharide ABC transporter ATP-binding protein [Acidobacteriota bacterium]
IARALILSPKFFLLDEPFAGIDPLAVIDIQKIVMMLKEQGLGVVITDHNVRETLKITDDAYMISEGTLFRHGTPKELAEDEEVKRTYLGEGFSLN